MLSLILVVIIVSRVIYCMKRKKKVFSKEFFLDASTRDDPAWWPLLLIFVIGFVIITYSAMINYIKNYDVNIEAITYYRNNITQLESQITKLDTEIEETELNFKLSEEEKNTLLKGFKAQKKELEIQIEDNNTALNKLPLKQNPRTIAVYKFLLYFGH